MKPTEPRRYYEIREGGKRAPGTHLYGSLKLAKRLANGRSVVEVWCMHPETFHNGRFLDDPAYKRRKRV